MVYKMVKKGSPTIRRRSSRSGYCTFWNAVGTFTSLGIGIAAGTEEQILVLVPKVDMSVFSQWWFVWTHSYICIRVQFGEIKSTWSFSCQICRWINLSVVYFWSYVILLIYWDWCDFPTQAWTKPPPAVKGKTEIKYIQLLLWYLSIFFVLLWQFCLFLSTCSSL